MKSSKIFAKKMNFGFTMVELLTALIIFALLATIGFPTYREYQNRARISEAENVVGTLERHSVAYLLEHGSFYSAAPSPASVPGIVSYGDSSSFTGGADWAALGLPVAVGSDVSFSYQAFAGQTTSSGIPVVGNHLHAATENMNLERGSLTASNGYPFPGSAGLASLKEEKLRFDWSDFNLCSFAAGEAEVQPSTTGATCWDYCKKLGGTDAVCKQQCDLGDAGCFEVCLKSGELRSTCETKCKSGATGDESLEQKKLRCYNQCGNDSKCMNSCMDGTTSNPTNNDRDCNVACRGQASCSNACRSGQKEYRESDDHKKNRCRHSCGGDRQREERCLNGEDDSDDDCQSKCRGNSSCIARCQSDGHSSCKDACRGDHKCMERCDHTSCQASCFGDHNCLRQCKHNNCQQTCGGDRNRERECIDNEDEDDGGSHCVIRCISEGKNLSECRRQCNTDEGDDEDGGGCSGGHCPRGYTWDREQRKCIQNDDHECPSGQTWNGKECAGEDHNCPEGQVWDADRGCSPEVDLYDCPEGQTWNGTTCVTGGGGPTCPEGTSYSVTTGQCVAFCPQGQTWNGTTCSGGGGGGEGGPTDCNPPAVWNGTQCVVNDDDGGDDPSGGECASFGVRAPTDFGVPATGVPGMDFVVLSAVGNFSPGQQCTLMVKVIQTRAKKVTRSESIYIYKGE